MSTLPVLFRGRTPALASTRAETPFKMSRNCDGFVLSKKGMVREGNDEEEDNGVGAAFEGPARAEVGRETLVSEGRERGKDGLDVGCGV